MKSYRIIFLLLFASAHVVHTMDDPQRAALVAYFLKHPPSAMSDKILDDIRKSYFTLDPFASADMDCSNDELYAHYYSYENTPPDPTYARLQLNGQSAQALLPVNSKGGMSITLPYLSVINQNSIQKTIPLQSSLHCYKTLTQDTTSS